MSSNLFSGNPRIRPLKYPPGQKRRRTPVAFHPVPVPVDVDPRRKRGRIVQKLNSLNWVICSLMALGLVIYMLMIFIW